MPEERRAWHAGISHWRGHSVLNGRSVGIEIVNPGHEWGYGRSRRCRWRRSASCASASWPPPDPARNVVAHSDIAPDRKEDPGELFDWEGLARNGVGLWPPDGAPPVEDVPAALATIGYRTDLPLPVLLRAFQRRWRQDAVTGEADLGTRVRLAAVVAACEKARPGLGPGPAGA